MTRQERDRFETEEARRIHREVVIVDDTDTEYEAAEEETPFAYEEQDEEERSERLNPLTMITTGRILPTGNRAYYRYFIAIALMCFFSIFITFMSLNASREYRQREQYASVLHERAVLKEEERYSLSSKQDVTARLKHHGIELIDLTNDSRRIKE